jgi:uncharacterized protein (TIGR02118 family)
MPKLIVLYPPPADVATFERRYLTEHVPMVAKIPGLRKFVAAQVIGAPAGAAPYQRVAELYFDSSDALQSAVSSPSGQAAVLTRTKFRPAGRPS